MSSNPLSGAGYFFRGLQLINQPDVRRFVIIPLLINILVFSLLFWSISSYVGGFIDSFIPDLPDWLAWLEYLIWVLFALSAGVILFFGFTIVANLVGAPFNGYLAAAVEKKLTGQTPPEATARWARRSFSPWAANCARSSTSSYGRFPYSLSPSSRPST